MAKLISNKVKKVSSDQADPNRYEFLSLEHAEPDLGVPAGDGYFLVSNTDGSREWTLTIDATTLEGNTASDLQDFAIQQANDAYSNSISYIDSEISNLVNSAPGFLDTLNELASAINDDENFAVTVTNQISNAYSNAVSEATILANNAFTNAVAYVDEQTTDTIEEGNTNLYYTDTRTRDSLSAAGDLTYNSNTGQFSVTTYKSTDFDTDFFNKSTDELSEGSNNLYYLDSRVDSHLSGANGITYDSGAIAADQDISSGANVTFTEVTGLVVPTSNTDATNKLYVDDLTDNAYSNAVSEATSLASNAYSNAVSYVDTEIANLVNTAPTVLDTLNELASAINDDPDFANSVASQISTAYSNAVSEAISLAADAYANAVAHVDSQTTDTIEEGANNLYHTEERVRDSLSSSGDLVYDSNTGEFSVVTYKSSDFDTDFSGKLTDDLTEGSNNLYFTEERVVDAVENNTVNTVSVESNLIVPVGNTTSRPETAVIGMIRFNTEFGDFEGYDGNQWVQLGSAFGFEGDLDLMEGTEDLQTSDTGTQDLN